MTVINFPKTQGVLSARQSACELAQYVNVATTKAEQALRSTGKAKKLETCVFRFCRFLGAYTALASTMELNAKILCTAAEEEGHKVAAQRIEFFLELALHDATGKLAFQALPNDAKTRAGIRETRMDRQMVLTFDFRSRRSPLFSRRWLRFVQSSA